MILCLMFYLELVSLRDLLIFFFINIFSYMIMRFYIARPMSSKQLRHIVLRVTNFWYE